MMAVPFIKKYSMEWNQHECHFERWWTCIFDQVIRNELIVAYLHLPDQSIVDRAESMSSKFQRGLHV